MLLCIGLLAVAPPTQQTQAQTTDSSTSSPIERPKPNNDEAMAALDEVIALYVSSLRARELGSLYMVWSRRQGVADATGNPEAKGLAALAGMMHGRAQIFAQVIAMLWVAPQEPLNRDFINARLEYWLKLSGMPVEEEFDPIVHLLQMVLSSTFGELAIEFNTYQKLVESLNGMVQQALSQTIHLQILEEERKLKADAKLIVAAEERVNKAAVELEKAANAVEKGPTAQAEQVLGRAVGALGKAMSAIMQVVEFRHTATALPDEMHPDYADSVAAVERAVAPLLAMHTQLETAQSDARSLHGLAKDLKQSKENIRDDNEAQISQAGLRGHGTAARTMQASLSEGAANLKAYIEALGEEGGADRELLKARLRASNDPTVQFAIENMRSVADHLAAAVEVFNPDADVAVEETEGGDRKIQLTGGTVSLEDLDRGRTHFLEVNKLSVAMEALAQERIESGTVDPRIQELRAALESEGDVQSLEQIKADFEALFSIVRDLAIELAARTGEDSAVGAFRMTGETVETVYSHIDAPQYSAYRSMEFPLFRLHLTMGPMNSVRRALEIRRELRRLEAFLADEEATLQPLFAAIEKARQNMESVMSQSPRGDVLATPVSWFSPERCIQQMGDTHGLFVAGLVAGVMDPTSSTASRGEWLPTQMQGFLYSIGNFLLEVAEQIPEAENIFFSAASEQLAGDSQTSLAQLFWRHLLFLVRQRGENETAVLARIAHYGGEPEPLATDELAATYHADLTIAPYYMELVGYPADDPVQMAALPLEAYESALELWGLLLPIPETEASQAFFQLRDPLRAWVEEQFAMERGRAEARESSETPSATPRVNRESLREAVLNLVTYHEVLRQRNNEGSLEDKTVLEDLTNLLALFLSTAQGRPLAIMHSEVLQSEIADETDARLAQAEAGRRVMATFERTGLATLLKNGEFKALKGATNVTDAMVAESLQVLCAATGRSRSHLASLTSRASVVPIRPR